MAIREAADKPWKILDGEETVVDIIDEEPDTETRRKRSRSPTRDEPNPKRTKVDGAACLAPRISVAAQNVFKSLVGGNHDLGAGDLFLTDGFRERWCRCPSVRASPAFRSWFLFFSVFHL